MNTKEIKDQLNLGRSKADKEKATYMYRRIMGIFSASGISKLGPVVTTVLHESGVPLSKILNESTANAVCNHLEKKAGLNREF